METLAAVAFIVVVAAIFAGVITLVVVVGRRNRRSRGDRQALMALARERGWSYRQSDVGTADRYRGSHPFPRISHNLRVSDLVTGDFRGRACRGFELRRLVGTPGNRRGADRRMYEYYRVFAMATPLTGASLEIRAAGVGDKLLRKLGRRGQVGGSVVTDPEFRQRFEVTGDEALARALLRTDVQRWLLTDPRAQQLPLRFVDDEVITWQRGRLRPDTVDPALQWLSEVVDRVSSAGWQGGRP